MYVTPFVSTLSFLYFSFIFLVFLHLVVRHPQAERGRPVSVRGRAAGRCDLFLSHLISFFLHSSSCYFISSCSRLDPISFIRLFFVCFSRCFWHNYRLNRMWKAYSCSRRLWSCSPLLACTSSSSRYTSPLYTPTKQGQLTVSRYTIFFFFHYTIKKTRFRVIIL